MLQIVHDHITSVTNYKYVTERKFVVTSENFQAVGSVIVEIINRNRSLSNSIINVYFVRLSIYTFERKFEA
jgi:hypothetical protein